MASRDSRIVNRRFLLMVALAWLPASRVAADEVVGVLAVGEPPGPTPEAVTLTSQLRAMIAERSGGVLGAAQVRERMTGSRSSATLSELDRAYAGALARFQAGEHEAAVRTLRAIVQDLERLPDSPDGFAQWSRAMLMLGRFEQAVGRDSDAEAALSRLVRVNPDVAVDPADFPPSFVALVERLRIEASAARRLQLAVKSRQGVRVFVDGRDVGLAPVVVRLAPGRYRISGAYRDVIIPGVTANLVAADAAVELDVQMAEMLRPESGPGLALGATDRARRVVTAAAWLGLDRVYTASLARQADVTYLVGSNYDVGRGAVEREGSVRLVGKEPRPGGVADLAAFLVTGRSPGPIDPWPPPPPPTPRSSRTLGWTAVGSGAAAVLMGGFSVYSMIQSNARYRDARAMLAADGGLRTPYTASQYNAKIVDGDQARRLAVATGIGAGVALATSGVLGYLSYRQTGEIGPFRF